MILNHPRFGSVSWMIGYVSNPGRKNPGTPIIVLGQYDIVETLIYTHRRVSFHCNALSQNFGARVFFSCLHCRGLLPGLAAEFLCNALSQSLIARLRAIHRAGGGPNWDSCGRFSDARCRHFRDTERGWTGHGYLWARSPCPMNCTKDRRRLRSSSIRGRYANLI